MSLNNHKTAASIEIEIRMTRLYHDSAILLLEGADDGRFWRGRIVEDCDLLITGGRSALLEAITIVDDRPITGVLAAADPDYDRLQGTLPKSPNLFFTDAHDLETTLAKLGALRRVIVALGEVEKIRAFEARKGSSVGLALAKITAEFGTYRWLNIRSIAPVSMGWLRPDRYLDRKTLAVARSRLNTDAVRAGLAADVGALTGALADLPAADPWQVAQGHDLIAVVTAALRRCLGSLPASRGPKDVALALRLAVDARELAQTDMFQGMLAWQAGHKQYAVLHEPDK